MDAGAIRGRVESTATNPRCSAADTPKASVAPCVAPMSAPASAGPAMLDSSRPVLDQALALTKCSTGSSEGSSVLTDGDLKAPATPMQNRMA